MEENNKKARKSGLSFLVKTLTGITTGEEKTYFLKKHPFGLKTEEDQTICFCGYPGHPRISTMVREIAYFLMMDSVVGLSVIKIRVAPEEEKFRIYYEVMTESGMILCGGCSNYTTAERINKDNMDSLFCTISTEYDINIKEIEIPYKKGFQMTQTLLEELRK